jgi:hypothetical protein
VLKNVLEVSIDQQYKIINLGSVKAQNLVAEFLKVLENSLSTEGTFDLKKKITDIQDHFKKQEHLDDPFRENVQYPSYLSDKFGAQRIVVSILEDTRRV